MSDLSSISELSDEEEIEQVQPIARRQFRDRQNHFDVFNEAEFKARYRFSKASVMQMVHMFGHELEAPSRQNRPLTPQNQILIALRFYATGAFQQLLGDHNNVSKSTVCRTIHKVSRCLARRKQQYIQMPTAEELPAIKSAFYALRQFPNVIGAIDCTHIRIQSPGGPNAEVFRNRKGYFSINVQSVCDAHLRIRNIVVRWPGSVHDSTIFNDCPLKVDLENNRYPNCYLLGDNGYPCKKYLLTPFLNPIGPAEEAFNVAHIATRNPAERTFGLGKRRFPCLHTELKTKVDNSITIIMACAVLHNMAIEFRDEPPEDGQLFPEADFDLAQHENARENRPHRNENFSVRDLLVRTRFQQQHN